MSLKLWLFERTDIIDYDEYISDVVCAEIEDDARKMSTVGWYQGVSVKLLGLAADGVPEGLILTSFKAG